jgi:hypothetical protein
MDNGRMLMLEAAALFILLGVLVFGVVTVLTARPKQQNQPGAAGRWRAAHYDAGDVTRVVVQKSSPNGGHLLDEHVVAELRRDDPDYEARFLEAMGTARERQSLFEAEED